MQNRLEKLRQMRRARGMTLIEIMVVLVILGLIASAIAYNVFGQLKEAQITTAKLDLQAISNGVDLYHVETGNWPDGLGQLVPKFVREVHKDPWWWDGAEPLWVTAERAGIRSATMFWPGSDVAWGGTMAAEKPHEVSGGTRPSDPFKPFSSPLSAFAGKTYPELITLFNGSFGGAWLDVSPTGLTSFQFVRLDVATNQRLILDAVTAVPEPASISLLGAAAALTLSKRRRSPWSRPSTNYALLCPRTPRRFERARGP